MRHVRGVFLLAGALLFLIQCNGKPTSTTTDRQSKASAVKPEVPAVKPEATAKEAPAKNSHADRRLLQGDFADGPSVTRACLKCHAKVGKDMVHTAHWTWSGPTPGVEGHGTGNTVGKRNLVNNFCIAVPGNEGRCAQCHVGYGWVDNSFNFEDPSRVDCLACHDSTGTYSKAKMSGGVPEATVDLGKVARNVGKTSLASCGSCHFFGGGGDNIKLPNMGTSLLNATAEVDVHMGGEGLTCSDCHKAEGHCIAGSGAHLPVMERSLSCQNCHKSPVHDDDEIEKHTAHVACQTCHIPTMARSQATKIDWRWSKAGDGTRGPEPDKLGKPTYNKKKGEFKWAKGVRPTLAWYDGRSRRMVLGDSFDPEKTPVTISAPVATIDDTGAKLYPFKVMHGDQPADAKLHVLLSPHLAGTKAGPNPYWKSFDWGLALKEGAAASGIPYSGEYEFVTTEMYMSVNHGVAPADQALSCEACHDGGIDFKALGYKGDPMETGGRKQPSPSK